MKGQSTRAEDIIFLAKVYDWKLIKHNPVYTELSFNREGVGLTVWYNKMTVRTALKHPRKGKTQLFRKKVGMKLLERIFNNPRTHTKKGYIKKINMP